MHTELVMPGTEVPPRNLMGWSVNYSGTKQCPAFKVIKTYPGQKKSTALYIGCKWDEELAKRKIIESGIIGYRKQQHVIVTNTISEMYGQIGDLLEWRGNVCKVQFAHRIKILNTTDVRNTNNKETKICKMDIVLVKRNLNLFAEGEIGIVGVHTHERILEDNKYIDKGLAVIYFEGDICYQYTNSQLTKIMSAKDYEYTQTRREQYDNSIPSFI